jgi:cytochrome c oxidase cbb3-type subunit 3
MADQTNESGGDGPRLLEHEYDGIREYDNPMPGWWLLTFAGTVIFSVIYLFNVGPIGNGKGRVADYEAEMAAAAALQPATPSRPEAAALLAMASDEEAVEEGEEVYKSYCASCHGPDGGGLIGPNLADANWIHGGAPDSVYNTIAVGVLAKGMPPWEKSLTPKQMSEVTAYVLSLRGTSPTNPKPPEGEPYTP